MIMKTKIIKTIFRQRAVLACSLIGILMFLQESNANDLNKDPIPAKSTVPINYYQGFMICLAGCYGIYLFVRARRKKRTDEL